MLLLRRTLFSVAATLVIAAPAFAQGSPGCLDGVAQESIYGPGEGLGPRDLCPPAEPKSITVVERMSTEHAQEGTRVKAAQDEPAGSRRVVDDALNRELDGGG